MTLTPDQLDRISQVSDPVIRQRFALFYQLPQDLQGSMFSEVTSGNIWKITRDKYNLEDNQVSTVAKIIGLIFLGELPIKNFIMALKNELGVDMPKAQAIAQDINQVIFQPVRESLMQVHNINPKVPGSPATPPAPPQVNSQRTREEFLAKLKAQQPQMQPPQPSDRPPFQARPAQYYIVPRKNVIDLRANKRKNRKKYKGFFASY